MENIKTAGDVLKSKLDPKIIILNNSDYTFNKVIEAMQEFASLQSSKDKQRIAELEKAQKRSVNLLSISEQTFTKVAGVIAMIRNVAMRPEDSEVSVSEALGVIDIDDSLELASAKIKDHLATLPSNPL